MPTQEQFSKKRQREKTLEILIPTFLGVLWEKGIPGSKETGSAKAWLGSQLELSASYLRPNAYMLSAWWSAPRLDTSKVFSAHVTTDPNGADPEFFRYLGGCCGILSWKRGAWEDLLVQAGVCPRPIGSVDEGLLSPERYRVSPENRLIH
jgi:hypothetical protein